MTTLSSSSLLKAAVAAAGIFVAGFVPVQAGDFSSAHVVRPKAGLSLELGAKKAVGYYVPDQGGCDLTLLVGEAGEAVSDLKKGAVPARFTTLVAAGRTARIDTGEGSSVEFFCSTGASFLTTRVIERVAYSAGPQS